MIRDEWSEIFPEEFDPLVWPYGEDDLDPDCSGLIEED